MEIVTVSASKVPPAKGWSHLRERVPKGPGPSAAATGSMLGTAGTLMREESQKGSSDSPEELSCSEKAFVNTLAQALHNRSLKLYSKQQLMAPE